MRQHRGYSEANAWELERPSPQRRAAPCPYAERCGGCDLMALTPDAQRVVKHDMVVEILRRTARIDASTAGQTPLEWDDGDADYSRLPEAAGVTLQYRTRIRLHIDGGGRLGFLAERSHAVVPIAHCAVATQRVNDVLQALVALTALRPELVRHFEQVEIRALGDVAEVVWIPKTERGKHRSAATMASADLETIERHLRAEAPQLALHVVSANETQRRWREFVQSVSTTDSLLEREHTSGALALHDEDCERRPARLCFAPGTFTQVNWNVNRRLIANVEAGAKQRGSRRFLDLFCGVGNFSLPLLALGLHGVGVESNPTSIEVATWAASRQGLRAQFHAEDVAAAVDRLIAAGEKFDLILLDPPRAGFKDVVGKLVHLAPEHLFICACDPVTFARDLRSLMSQGFVLERLQAFDMFPQTHHVECAAWLRSAEPRTPSPNPADASEISD